MEAQRDDPNAVVHRYRELLAVRKAHPDLYEGDFEVLDAPNTSVAIVRRGAALLIANLSAEPISHDLGGQTAHEIFTSADSATIGEAVTVPAETSVLFTLT